MFRLKIKMGNAAVMEAEDIAALLENVAGRVRCFGCAANGPIIDSNGNRVGDWDYKPPRQRKEDV